MISIQIQDVYDLFLFIIVLHEPVACLAISGTNGTYNKHDYFNQYVPAPEHLEVTEDMLSPLNKFCMEKCTKLTPIYMISTNMSFTTELCNSTKNLVWC